MTDPRMPQVTASTPGKPIVVTAGQNYPLRGPRMFCEDIDKGTGIRGRIVRPGVIHVTGMGKSLADLDHRKDDSISLASYALVGLIPPSVDDVIVVHDERAEKGELHVKVPLDFGDNDAVAEIMGPLEWRGHKVKRAFGAKRVSVGGYPRQDIHVLIRGTKPANDPWWGRLVLSLLGEFFIVVREHHIPHIPNGWNRE